MATEYYLVTQNGSAGSYWANLTTDQKNRYYWGGAYQVYSNFNDLEDQRINQAVNRDPSKSIVIEVQGKWDDASTWNINTIWLGYYSVTITTKINGVRDPDSYHGGVPGGGFRRIINITSYAVFQIQKQSNMTIDGLEIINQATTGGYAVRVYYAANARVKNCIITAYRGIDAQGYNSFYGNNIFRNCTLCGINLSNNFGFGDVVYNNLATGCGTGFYTDTAGTYATVINNVAIGNTTNWKVAGINSNAYATNNAGLSGEAWNSTGGTQVTVATTDFVNLAGGDYTYTSGSPLINAGLKFIAFEEDNYDVLNKYRPDYESSTYPNNVWDVGPFEYDHGEGNTPPASCTITISAPVSLVGAEIRIYDNDNTPAGSFGTELAGTESHTSSTYTYTGLQGNSIAIQIMQSGYEEFVQVYIVPATTALDFYARMTPETNA